MLVRSSYEITVDGECTELIELVFLFPSVLYLNYSSSSLSSCKMAESQVSFSLFSLCNISFLLLFINSSLLITSYFGISFLPFIIKSSPFFYLVIIDISLCFSSLLFYLFSKLVFFIFLSFLSKLFFYK